jgi:putative oxygen-independent coproporphyrinogen III oxidase
VSTVQALAVPTAAYIHIPFCRRRCFYCDFPIAVAGDHARGDTSPRMAAYVETLCREIQATPRLNRDRPLDTVFFGGGTPSLLSAPQVAQILTVLEACLGLAPGAEISMEMDPGSFDLPHLQVLHTLGLNRISLGVQAFQDALLAACGRTHRRQDVDQAIADLVAVGIQNWSLDLISGLPHQTLDIWQASLETAIAHAPAHISVYDLTVEPGTVFEHRYHPGEAPLPTDEATTAMYRLTQATLTAAGYDHYEISNYARPGYHCRHNRVYWENRPYYGFGMGATSYTCHQRFSRPRTTDTYRVWVEDYVARGGQIDCTPTPRQEQWLDQLMVGLRLRAGVDLRALAATYGTAAVAELRALLTPEIHKGWVVIDPIPAPRLRLTDPEGFLFSNQVLVKLFDRWGG